MLSGTRAWAGLQHAQILCHVAVLKRSLSIPEGTPAVLADLMKRCLAPEPENRPTFSQVAEELQVYLQRN